MNKKLKPCPFCGCEFNLDDGLWENEGIPGTYFIQCPYCQAEIANDGPVDVAIERWNTRANGWHDAKKDLPENDRNVLTYTVTNDTSYFEIGRFVDGAWLTAGFEEVVAWRELPELPEFGND